MTEQEMEKFAELIVNKLIAKQAEIIMKSCIQIMKARK
jgi:hypothetical protein